MTESVKKHLNSYIRNHSKNELMQMCKSHNLDLSGKKNDLALRLVSFEHKETTNSLFPSQKSKLEFTPPVIQIEKNELGNLIHSDSNLVFDAHSRRVIGVQHSDGVVRDLQLEDIDQCKKYKFPYELPLVLNDNITIYEILENSDFENENPSLSSSEDELDLVPPEEEEEEDFF